MLDKEYAVNILTALVDAAEEMNGHGIKAKCLAVNDAVFDTIRGLIPYLQNSEEVVRCKDCKWYDLTDPCGTLTPNAHRCKRVTRLWIEDDAYCSYGERREDDNR